ncbi:MAG: AbrB family transcriptional regulator [Dehalococcoidia bacterium]|nr:AbrB family transcriptional regulator [Dehalococcoidia bacterium]
MKQITASITQRGQVTIPAEIRRLLGAKPRGKIVFQIDGGEVRLAPVEFTLETAYGSVKPLHRPENFKKLIGEAMEEHAEEVVRKMQGQ